LLAFGGKIRDDIINDFNVSVKQRRDAADGQGARRSLVAAAPGCAYFAHHELVSGDE
jgi:hypothetical protein